MASGSVNDPRARRASRIRPLEETLNGATGVMRDTLGEKQPEMMALHCKMTWRHAGM